MKCDKCTASPPTILLQWALRHTPCLTHAPCVPTLSCKQAMERIHAITADGTVLTDVEVFRRLYEAVGLGWVYAVTKIEPIGRAADALYSV